VSRAFLLAVIALGSTARAAAAGDPAERLWSGGSALTVPKGRFEIGLFQRSHYGLTDRVELSTHPVLLFALPHVELKATALETRHAAIGVSARLAYPTPFLRLVSREGAGGLLPATSRPPQAIQIEIDDVTTLFWLPWQRASLWAGLAVAPHASFTERELPLLDFPFLYPRFAPLYAPVVPRAAIELEGRVAWRIFYDLLLRGTLMPQLPYVGSAIAVEENAGLELRISDHVAVSAGLLASEAEYPIGWRLHLLPYLDARVGW
jgi:hypothetical protein